MNILGPAMYSQRLTGQKNVMDLLGSIENLTINLFIIYGFLTILFFFGILFNDYI